MGERILISTRRLVGYFTKNNIFDQQLIIVTPQLKQHIISMPWPLLIGNRTWFLGKIGLQ